MGHTFTHLLNHIIFSTKGRVPYLRVEARDDVFAYMGGIIREIGGAALIIGGTVDHVHLLTKLRASIALADVLEVVKTNSSRWIHKQRVLHPKFGWLRSFAPPGRSTMARRIRELTQQVATIFRPSGAVAPPWGAAIHFIHTSSRKGASAHASITNGFVALDVPGHKTSGVRTSENGSGDSPGQQNYAK